MGEEFTAFRRDAEYLPCDEADIQPLVPNLTFIRNKRSWGFVFRFGFFEIPEPDFQTISRAMNFKSLSISMARAQPMKINKDWHEKNRMPKNPTLRATDGVAYCSRCELRVSPAYRKAEGGNRTIPG